MNLLALTWPKRGTHGQSRGARPANSTLLCSRQIQILSWTYISWLKQPTKTGEICHFLQDWTFLSAAAAVGSLLLSLSGCALSFHDISASFLVPSCICFLFYFPSHNLPWPHNHGIMISPSVFISYVWCTTASAMSSLRHKWWSCDHKKNNLKNFCNCRMINAAGKQLWILSVSGRHTRARLSPWWHVVCLATAK